MNSEQFDPGDDLSKWFDVRRYARMAQLPNISGCSTWQDAYRITCEAALNAVENAAALRVKVAQLEAELAAVHPPRDPGAAIMPPKSRITPPAPFGTCTPTYPKE